MTALAVCFALEVLVVAFVWLRRRTTCTGKCVISCRQRAGEWGGSLAHSGAWEERAGMITAVETV